jgi:predicted RNA binding protein YcfA (HicA-like mRNA interferase family)
MKVRDVIKQIKNDGWYLVATRGSHRQFKHPVKPGRVTISGKPGDDVAIGTLEVFTNKRGSNEKIFSGC